MGSSSCKAVAFSDDGEILSHAMQTYAPQCTHPYWAEILPEVFWDALCSVTRRAAAGLQNDPPRQLCISSHGETFVPVDAKQRPVAPAILNVDNRAVQEAQWVEDAVGRRRLFEITGQAPHPMYPLPKMMWLRENSRDVYEDSKRFLALPSYLLSRAGLPPYVDYSLASRFLAFDISRQCWSDDILKACGLTSDQLPVPVPTGSSAGRLSAGVAKDLALPAGTQVIVGGHDQPCGALGMGVLEAGRVSASLGTYECLVSASETPAINDAAYTANLNTYCHVVPGRFVTLAYFPAGIMLDWLSRLLAVSGEHGSAFYEDLEGQVSEGPSGLSVMPHLPGSSTPDFNPFASGVITGIRANTTRSDLYKGILEGIACEFACAIQLLEKAVGPIREIHLSGGGSHSRLGLRLRASISGHPLSRARSSEAVCLGTAIVCAVGAGLYSGFREALDRFAADTEIVAPEFSLTSLYRHSLEKHRLLYASLATLREAQASRPI
jgi:xylulokinase